MSSRRQSSTSLRKTSVSPASVTMGWGRMDLGWDLKFGPETKVMVRARGSIKTEVIMEYWGPIVKERG